MVNVRDLFITYVINESLLKYKDTYVLAVKLFDQGYAFSTRVFWLPYNRIPWRMSLFFFNKMHFEK